ncbi:MAG: tRNA (adenosine(37)-N6)-dimethylallyltransferase MiaA [Bacilli bacterium]|nr:tRNA (adenosine(37)-N6)-dimethylallyltransferase MiaA [Bacilli bacterium]
MTYVILGPTGIGKTSLAVDIAEVLDCPIISCDAYQIYKDMNIGTGKIMPDEKGFERHYLINKITPEETYSVKEYQKDFREIYEKLSKDNKNIVVVGGTGLYIKAALYDYSFETYEDDTSDLEKMDNHTLYELLLKLDPESTKTIHENNRKRVIHAISVARSCDTTKSESIVNQEHKLVYDGIKFIFVNPNRELVYERINKRVDGMFESGLVEEVKNLLSKYSFSVTAKEAIGYKEVISYFNGEISYDDCVELIKKRSRNYAKRQVTFFKHQFNCETYSTIEEAKEVILNE